MKYHEKNDNATVMSTERTREIFGIRSYIPLYTIHCITGKWNRYMPYDTFGIRPMKFNFGV